MQTDDKSSCMMPVEVARAASWLIVSRNMLILAGISACPHSTYKAVALGIGITWGETENIVYALVDVGI